MRRILLAFCVIGLLASCGGNQQNTAASSPAATTKTIDAAPKNLNMSFGTFRLRVNSSFKALDLPYKISVGEWPVPEKGSAEANSIIQLDKNLIATLVIDTKTDKITTLGASFTVTQDNSYNIQLANAALVLLSSADGEKMAVIDQLQEMLSEAMDDYPKSKHKDHLTQKTLVHNGVTYSITIRDHMPVMLSARVK